MKRQRETEMFEEERDRPSGMGRAIYKILKSRWFRYAAIVAGILAVVLIAAYAIRNRKFDSYEITEIEEGNTGTFQYSALGGYILRYGPDGARLTDEEGAVLWTISYSMRAPSLANCGSTAAIYDKNGTAIVVCDEKGQIGAFAAEMPILKAEVAEQGVTAAILEDGTDTWIQYYDQQGSAIASFKTAMDSTGYPLDIGLSRDGILMAVSFLKYEDGVPGTELNFYNFGSAGQIQVDNQVSSFSYENILSPEVTYLDKDTCVAFREDGFTVFGGGQIPEEKGSANVEQKIVSAFCDSSYIGLILENDSGSAPFLLELYGKDGSLLFQQEMDYDYQSVEIEAGQILLYNRTGFCVYSTDGVEKFRGELKNVIVDQLLGIGRNRFALITEEGLYRVQLK